MGPRATISRIGFALTFVTACNAESYAAGYTAPPGSLLAEPLQPLPTTMSEIGLFVDPADPSTLVDAAIPYTPRWPLWSGGTEKQRYLVLPTDTKIDNRERVTWQYPPGTLWFKTFSAQSRPLETRLLRLREDDSWEVATYRWNEAGTEAEQTNGDFEEVVNLDNGSVHTIPSRLMCRECHESAADMILGDSELQLGQGLNGEPSPLERLQSRGVLVAPLPASPRKVSDHTDDAETEAVLGNFVGNCVHCHNGEQGPSSSFDLDPATALRNTIGRETQSSASAAGIRIVPGRPLDSVLFLAVSREHDNPEIAAMPPVGVDVLDNPNIERLRSFIEELQ